MGMIVGLYLKVVSRRGGKKTARNSICSGLFAKRGKDAWEQHHSITIPNRQMSMSVGKKKESVYFISFERGKRET